MARSLVDDIRGWLDSNPEATTDQLDARRSLRQNAEVGYYADRAEDLARDLADAGAPVEACDDARAGVYDSEQRSLVGKNTPAGGAPRDESDDDDRGDDDKRDEDPARAGATPRQPQAQTGKGAKPPKGATRNPHAPQTPEREVVAAAKAEGAPHAEKAPEDTTPKTTAGGST